MAKTNETQKISLIIALLAIAAATGSTLARTQISSSSSTSRARIALSHALPQLDGRHLKISVVEVSYPPGASSAPHSHPCPVIGYIVEGTIRTQVEDEPEMVYRAGESFYEAPNGVHLISGNASDKEPAKLIAYFTCDRETPLSVAVPETQPNGGKQP